MTHATHVNGAWSAANAEFVDERSLRQHAREIQHDATALAEAVRDASSAAQQTLTHQLKQRPYVTLGAALGIGYVLGGGLNSRLTVVLLGAATRFATVLATREISARLFPSSNTPPRSVAVERV